MNVVPHPPTPPQNDIRKRGRAGPWPLSWWTTSRCDLTNRLPRVRHVQSSPAPGREPPLPPPTRIGAEALNATDDEKIRELVIALMGQEPGDEPRRPRTPLLAPFITHDVLLRVNNSLLRRRTTLSEGAGGCRPLLVVRWQPSRARRGRRARRMPGTRGNAMQARARRAVHAL